jgi:hypothetical protein
MKTNKYGSKLWLSANDTYNWANKPGASWPCSTLSGHKLFVEFDSNGICNIALDGKTAGIENIDNNELQAIISDLMPEV